MSKNASARVPGTRPKPQANLTPTQARIWRNVVATKPVGAFDAGSFPVLAAYCVLVDTWAGVAQQQPGADSISLQKLMQLTAQITRLATALRLTPQARYDPQTAHRGAKKLKGSRPWD